MFFFLFSFQSRYSSDFIIFGSVPKNRRRRNKLERYVFACYCFLRLIHAVVDPPLVSYSSLVLNILHFLGEKSLDWKEIT